MPWIPEEEIKRAREITAIEYLKKYQPNRLKKSSARNEWELTDHDSFKINEQTSQWHWKSRDIGGTSALNFLIHVDGCSFLEAVQMLKDEYPTYIPPPVEAKPKKPFVLPTASPDCRIAYIRYAEVYQAVTPSLSVEILQRVLANHPEYLLAQRTLGNVYSLQGSYAKAIGAYDKYMAGGLYSTDDLVHYASALFFDKQYGKAAEVLAKGKTMDPDNFLLKRLSFYDACETGKYQEGLDEANEFFQTPDGKFIWQDYLYYGRLLNKAKQYDQSLAALQQAQVLSSNNAHPEIYKDIANVCLNSGNDNAAIEAYTQYIEQAGETAEASDFYQLGKYYYGAAVKDSTLATDYLTKADSLFAIVKERVPASHLGVLWQARANSQMDPETEKGLAKPYYESTIPILEKNKDKYLKELSECYRYLGYYYYLKQDMDSSRLYWNKLLEIDPTNKTALEALKNIK